MRVIAGAKTFSLSAVKVAYTTMYRLAESDLSGTGPKNSPGGQDMAVFSVCFCLSRQVASRLRDARSLPLSVASLCACSCQAVASSWFICTRLASPPT
jgi:hypothetical protein